MLYLILAALQLTSAAYATYSNEPALAIVKNVGRAKILASNNVSIRTGSVYDNTTLFELLPGFPGPNFNYEFIDSELGASEPIYPLYQSGYQYSWFQVIPAAFLKNFRHIDHYTSLVTPEGCQVDGLYALRSTSEYPESKYRQERKEGYEEIVLRLEMYTRLRPDAQCGKHLSQKPDPNFNAMDFLKQHHDFMSFSEFPQKDLNRFEWKEYATHQFVEEQSLTKFPRFDLGKLKQNSLWYYPQGHSDDYDIREARPQRALAALNLPRHLMIPATAGLQKDLPLDHFLGLADFAKVIDFLNGRPTPDFVPAKEPGHDTLRLSDVTEKNIYTSGLYLENIKNVVADVSNPAHFALVGITLKPYEPQQDVSWEGEKIIPQIRFVYQLMDPRTPGRPFEQLYLHLKYDVVDRQADQASRDAQHRYFLNSIDELIQAQNRGDASYERLIRGFIAEFTQRPMESVSISSSLTGIWVFGAFSRSYNTERELQPVRIVRDGVDVGFYSTVYDNDLFREAIKNSDGRRKELLQKHMDDLTVSYFRDPKRQDASAITFNRTTCAQCHQTSGRDGIHFSFNDGIDRRITAPVRATEYFFREADRQLKVGQGYWLSEHP